MPLVAEVEVLPETVPVSILDGDQLLTIYGKSLCLAPVVGILGRYCSMEEMVEATLPLAEGLDAVNGDRGVRLAAHVVYGMARPCWGPGDSCLMYLEKHGFDIVGEYIELAAELGIEVVLDVQMGRSTPLLEVERMIDLGYLAYPNCPYRVGLGVRDGTGSGVAGFADRTVGRNEHQWRTASPGRLSAGNRFADAPGGDVAPVHR